MSEIKPTVPSPTHVTVSVAKKRLMDRQINLKKQSITTCHYRTLHNVVPPLDLYPRNFAIFVIILDQYRRNIGRKWLIPHFNRKTICDLCCIDNFSVEAIVFTAFDTFLFDF